MALHYRELIAWQKAMELVVVTYSLTKALPKDEIYGLTNQLRRASVSIPSNIAEGQGRGVGGEFAHHLRIANGSRQEVETQFMIARQLGYLTEHDLNKALDLSQEVGRVIAGLAKSLK